MSKYDDNNTVGRRQLFKLAVVGATTALLPIRSVFGLDARGLPVNETALAEDNSFAQAMGYKEDTHKVDSAKFPLHKKSQICSNCKQYKKVNAKWGNCKIITAGLVTSGGWCSSWVKKD